MDKVIKMFERMRKPRNQTGKNYKELLAEAIKKEPKTHGEYKNFLK